MYSALPLRSLGQQCGCIRLAARCYATATKTKTKLDTSLSQQSLSNPSPATASSEEAVYVQPPPSQPSGGFELRTYKPRTPGTRHLKRPINDHLWKGRPLRKLTFPKKGQGRGGRNSDGRITVRHRGGGHKRRIRTVDFNRMAPGKHTVDRIEHDPNRSAHIALVTNDKTGEQSYIIAAEGMRAGDSVQSYRSGLPADLIKSMGGTVDPGMLAAKTALRGNCLPIRMVPLGTQVYNVGSTAGKGAVFCRSAGTYAIVVSKEETARKCKEVVIRLMSGEIRRVAPDACATIGVASNMHYHFRQLGKAGRSRWLGIRPTVRGVAMNASMSNKPISHQCSSIDILQRTILMVADEERPRVTIILQVLGELRYVSACTPNPLQCLQVQQAKSGYKTRYKRNPNKFMVTDRPRNQGKRRSKA